MTQGQPWLVALAKEIVEEMVRDTNVAITPEHIHETKEVLIRRQETHLDSLAERLREPRVKAIIEPILAGLELGDVPNDDIQFLIDLGLCKTEPLRRICDRKSNFPRSITQGINGNTHDAIPLIYSC
ncbi:hypothetical protein RintRC_7745 [Richelia intracellularis]|nr:hypothetical protein RintRC_7745 [Richelia intracellularis]